MAYIIIITLQIRDRNAAFLHPSSIITFLPYTIEERQRKVLGTDIRRYRCLELETAWHRSLNPELVVHVDREGREVS